MVSPYLERPLRSYEEALRDRTERLAAAAAHHYGFTATDPLDVSLVEAAQANSLVVAVDNLPGGEPGLNVNDMLAEAPVSTLPLSEASPPTSAPIDAAPVPVVVVPLPPLELLDLGIPSAVVT